MPSTTTEWIAWAGVAVPLFGLSGSALAYVFRLYQEAATRRRERFFELTKYIYSKDLAIATKMAAIYQLREFHEHRDFIIRFCDSATKGVTGDAANLVRDELKRTADFFRESDGTRKE